MNRDDALQKIKKCLALASSSNPHEAAVAMRQAQKLMQQFGLSEVDVTLADVAESTALAKTVDLVQWEAVLSSMVAQAFGCHVYTSQRRKLSQTLTYRRERVYVFVGVGAAAEVASYAYDVLSRQCAKDRRAHIATQPKTCKPKTKTARGDAYAEGWCTGVKSKLEAFSGDERNAVLIAQYMQSRHTEMSSTAPKDRTQGKNVKHNDFHNGVQAGRNAQLDRGISAATPQALLCRFS